MKRCIALLVCLMGAIAIAVAANPPAPTAPAAPSPAGFSPEAFAGFGSELIHDNQLDQLGWSDAQIEGFLAGVRAALHGRGPAPSDESHRLGNEIADQIDYLKAHPAPPPAPPKPLAPAPSPSPELTDLLRTLQHRFLLQRSPSGLCYKIGNQDFGGARPTARDTVVMGFVCLGRDGKTPTPQLSVRQTRIKVSDLVPGLAEGVQMMTLGSHATFLLPPALSFGGGSWPDGIEPGTPLFFQVELYDVIAPDKAR